MDLVQKSMTVMKYEVSFVALSRFSPEMVSTKTLKCVHFEHALRPNIQERLAVYLTPAMSSW